MKMLTKAPRGTQDILPESSYKWRFIENLMLQQAALFGFREIRTPVFEHTELFLRSVGEDTDVVQKEMYTFLDKGKRSITLRPEGTAGAVRAVLEHGLYENLPVKLSYVTSCYRYEKPQAGRWREFSQFGCEMIGSAEPCADADIIMLAKTIFDRLNLSNISLEINSIGCSKCRGEYYKYLREYFEDNKDKLCSTCLSRLDKNPMRILDCKNHICSEVAAKSPSILEFICSECREHFEAVKKYLDVCNIKFSVNPMIVRGLDYYTRTVFEFVSQNADSKGLACCGGGRYDNLVEQISGKSIPALGFGFGMDRILLAMEKQNIVIPKPESCDIYFVTLGETAKYKAFMLAKALREASFNVELDMFNRSLKSQMKYANRICAKFVVVLGDEEMKTQRGKIKNMNSSKETGINLDERFLSEFFKIYVETKEALF